MISLARLALVTTGLMALAACEPQGQAIAPAAPAQPQPAPATPAPATTNAPHIYMALQPDPDGMTSVIFAIDEARNNTPLDDPAIRISPEDGKCNPQELRRYNFSVERARRPVFGDQEVQQGVTPRDLPNFMAMAVTSEMMRIGLIVNPDESKPQNVCTRKLWEQLVVNQSAG